MSLIGLIIVLVIIGVILYLINLYLPIDSKIKTILNIVIVLFVIIWLLQAFGLLAGLDTIRIR